MRPWRLRDLRVFFFKFLIGMYCRGEIILMAYFSSIVAFLAFSCVSPPRSSSCLRIDHLWVPEAMKNDSVDYAILDCDYSLDERDKDSLEVKWYFRYDPTPIYQWVPPNDPQVVTLSGRNISQFCTLKSVTSKLKK